MNFNTKLVTKLVNKMAVSALCATVGLSALTLNALAYDYKIGHIEIKHPFAHATVPTAKVAGGYMTIVNMGNEPDRLLSVTSDLTKDVQIHSMMIKDNVMQMREQSEGVNIPAGHQVKFDKHGYHIMFSNIPHGLKAGDKFNGVLNFEKAGKVNVVFEVEPMSGKMGDYAHDMKMQMHKVGQKVEDAGEAMKDGAQKAIEHTQEGMKNAHDNMKKMIENKSEDGAPQVR